MLSHNPSANTSIPLSAARLYAIIDNGNTDELEKFISQYKIEKNLNPALTDYFNTAIQDNFSAFAIATLKNNVFFMKKLIEAGANPNLQFEGALGPIHLASFHDLRDALEYLISIKVNLDLKSLSTNKTPIMYATVNDHAAVITLLAKANANVDETHNFGVTAAYMAVSLNKLNALQALIGCKANLDKTDDDGCAAIHIAAKANSFKALKMLVNAGANINVHTSKKLFDASALFFAVNAGNVESVKVIVDCERTELNSQSGEGKRTAIFEAVCELHLEIFELLLAKKADPYIPAYINDMEWSLRRLANYKKNRGNSPKLEKILSIIATIPKFPMYQSGIKFTYHSLSESGTKQALAVADDTQSSVTNSMFAPLYGHFDHSVFLRQFNDHPYFFDRSNSFSSAPKKPIRKKSYCSYDLDDKTSSVYVKCKTLGEGSFGSVSLMESSAANGTKLAIKEIPPDALKYSGFEEDEIYALIYDKYPAIAWEANVNYVIHGVGAVYCDQKPIAYDLQNNIKSLTDYPRCYIAMKHFTGIPLDQINIISSNTYFQIFLDLLIKVKEFHRKYIHGDIKHNNIILDHSDANNYKVNLVDFGLSRPAGQLLYLHNLNLDIKPPEFKGKIYIEVAANQDVYSTGGVLKKYYSKELFSDVLAAKVEKLYMSMQKENPEERISVEAAIQVLTNLKIADQREKYLANVCSDRNTFFNEFAKVSENSQISFLQSLDLNKVRYILHDFHHFFTIYQKIKPQNRSEFMKLMGRSHIVNLNIYVVSARVLEDFPAYLNSLKEMFGISVFEYRVQIFFKDSFNLNSYGNDLKRFINFSNVKVSKDFTNVVLKKIISDYMQTNDMKSCLKICDKFSDNPAIYKQILLIVNEIYRERRNADPRNYFSFFGRYSKNDKVQASMALDASLKSAQNDKKVFERGELNQGNLGRIAQRLKKCS